MKWELKKEKRSLLYFYYVILAIGDNTSLSIIKFIQNFKYTWKEFFKNMIPLCILYFTNIYIIIFNTVERQIITNLIEYRNTDRSNNG